MDMHSSRSDLITNMIKLPIILYSNQFELPTFKFELPTFKFELPTFKLKLPHKKLDTNNKYMSIDSYHHSQR